MAWTDYDNENSNVFAYMIDEGFCFQFLNNDILYDFEWIGELFFTSEYRNKRYYFDEDIIQNYDRFYKITNENKERIESWYRNNLSQFK